MNSFKEKKGVPSLLARTLFGALITRITNFWSDLYSLATIAWVGLVAHDRADNLLIQYKQYRERQLQQLNKEQLKHMKAIIPTNENLLSDDTRILTGNINF